MCLLFSSFFFKFLIYVFAGADGGPGGRVPLAAGREAALRERGGGRGGVRAGQQARRQGDPARLEGLSPAKAARQGGQEEGQGQGEGEKGKVTESQRKKNQHFLFNFCLFDIQH